MKRYLTLGLGYGDEGKGKVVDYLCAEESDPASTLVVRYSGGSQCGHNVFDSNGELIHEYSTIGSGTHRGISTYIGSGVYWNPIKFLNEYNVLEKKLGALPPIYVNNDSTIVTPLEVDKGRHATKENQHGTCGEGIFRTVLREREGYHLKAIDLKYPKIFTQKLSLISRELYSQDSCGDVDWNYIAHEVLSKIKLVDNIVDLPMVKNSSGTIIYESNQGLMLDEHIGYMPHCTPTPIIPPPIDDTMGGQSFFDECFLITRSYSTRHGEGPFPDETNHINMYENNRLNHFQGEFRTAYLDLDQLDYVTSHIKKRILIHEYILVINHLDVEHRKYIINGQVEDCGSESKFIEKIQRICERNLPIKKVLISHHPWSGSILKK